MQAVEHTACQRALHPQPATGGAFWCSKILTEITEITEIAEIAERQTGEER
jgi:hypothetical protein